MAEAASVVIPTRDRARIVVDTVRHVLDQRGVELEVIVVDDGSRDGTAHALAALHDPRVTVLRSPSSGGVSHARNRGIARAAHPWIAFLDDDDRWRPDKLHVQLERARTSDAGFVYSAGLAVSARSGRVLYLSPAFTPDELRQGIRSRNMVFAGSSNVLARAELVRRVGGFDESLHHIADWDMWIRLTEAGRGAACHEPLVAYVVHDSNMHRAAIDSAAREGRLLRAKHARSALPGRFDPVVFGRWIAEGQADSGRHGRAALTYAANALRHGNLRDGRRALGSALCAAGVRARRPPPAGEPAPDWAAIRP